MVLSDRPFKMARALAVFVVNEKHAEVQLTDGDIVPLGRYGSVSIRNG